MIKTGEAQVDFLTNQPVAGETLAARLAREPLSPEEALQCAIEIGTALGNAHARGLVHGRLSPFSILFTESGVKILPPPAFPEGRSAPYRSPEQVRGQEPDARSDIFSFGAVLYELATGKRAFRGEGQKVNHSILETAPPAIIPEHPAHAAMAAVVAGCLEKDPGARRQRIQNAVIELKLSGRGVPRKPSDGSVRPVSLRAPAATAPEPPALQPEVETGGQGPGQKPNDGGQGQGPGAGERKEPLSAAGGWLRPGAPRQRIPNPFFYTPPPTTAKKPGEQGLLAALRLLYTNPRAVIAAGGFGLRFWAVVSLVLITVGATGLAAVMYLRKTPQPPVLRFPVNAPEHTSYAGTPAVSPDGRFLAFSAVGPEGVRMLWLRPLDALHAIVISGTEGGFSPFWSPDSQYIGFFANKTLKRVHITGGDAQDLCATGSIAGGATWNADGTILFAPGLSGGLERIPAGGGKVQPVLQPNTGKSEFGYLWPQFLPDGNHFVFFVQTDQEETTGVYAGALDQPQYRRLFAAETNAIYSNVAQSDSQKNGYLLYMRDRSLMARSFNTSRLAVQGDSITLADDIGAVESLALAPISVSANAILIYQSIGPAMRQLVWMDRTGKELASIREGGIYGPPKISPDGTRAVVGKVTNETEKTADLFLVDLDGKLTQFTDTPLIHEASPIWSPDGSRIACSILGREEGNYDLYIKPVNGGRPEVLFRNSFRKYPTDWSHDGRYIFFNAVNQETRGDLWAIATADHHAGPILTTISTEEYGALSPDGKWLAFDSNESGHIEVYVQAFDGISAGTQRHWQISQGGGGLARWRRDGKELYYITPSGLMMAVAVHPTADGFAAGKPLVLFSTRPVPKAMNLYDVSPDGQRFLMNLPLEWASASPITVVTNWTEKLKD